MSAPTHTPSRRAVLAAAGGLAGGALAGRHRVLAASAPAGELALLETYVAGARADVAETVRGALEPGAPLRLVREPDNDYDGRAVAVWTPDGHKLGYVPRIDNKPLARLMDAGIMPVARVASLGRLRPRPDVRLVVSLARQGLAG